MACCFATHMSIGSHSSLSTPIFSFFLCLSFVDSDLSIVDVGVSNRCAAILNSLRTNTYVNITNTSLDVYTSSLYIHNPSDTHTNKHLPVHMHTQEKFNSVAKSRRSVNFISFILFYFFYHCRTHQMSLTVMVVCDSLEERKKKIHIRISFVFES